LFAGRPINIPQMMEQLIRTAKELDLPFGKREQTFNSRMAQELGKFAEQEGKGDDFHNSVFRAYFADGLNIGLPSTLADISAKVGLGSESVQEQRLDSIISDGCNRSTHVYDERDVRCGGPTL
jgi:predicted DsbA family dithiol-disulfide isomerase